MRSKRGLVIHALFQKKVSGGIVMDRISRISEEVKREISSIILNDIKDPRLPKFVSVVTANVSKDLRHAKVYISVFGNEEEKASAMEALKSASGFIRREIGQRLSLRYTPELNFVLDDSIEHGINISKLIDRGVK